MFHSLLSLEKSTVFWEERKHDYIDKTVKQLL